MIKYFKLKSLFALLILNILSLSGKGWFISVKEPSSGQHITLVHIDDTKWMSDYKKKYKNLKGGSSSLRLNIKSALQRACAQFPFSSLVLQTDHKSVYFGGPTIVQKILYNQHLRDLRNEIIKEITAQQIDYSRSWNFSPHITLQIKGVVIPQGKKIGDYARAAQSSTFTINSVEYNSPYEVISYNL
ncbi:2'-5' RNA ligase family protein [Candidatus Babeliales bacterium]|nr:2'-5' RNA ligase family protein [Candidatus Babeliales bacterium]